MNREFLESILLKSEIARDRYYFDMEKDVFDKAIKGDEWIDVTEEFEE